MEYLSWDLTILSKSVAYPNLSGASSHVGLSQPQLSRIVAKLEEQYGLVLLDRETRRKSSWTPAAYRLAEIYNKAFNKFRSEVTQLSGDMEPLHLRVGALEGLIPLAMDFCHKLFVATKIRIIELDVHDTSQLEEAFVKNELDLIFSSRVPGRKKFRYSVSLGFQSIQKISNGDLLVFSAFEYGHESFKDKQESKTFISNSLRVRSEWLARFGGTGTLPSDVHPRSSGKKNEVPVLLMAHDDLPPHYWQQITDVLQTTP